MTQQHFIFQSSDLVRFNQRNN